MTTNTETDTRTDRSTNDAIHVKGRDGADLGPAPGETLRFLRCGDERSPDVIDGIVPPGAGPPMHRHPWATFDVLIEGTLRAVVDGAEYRLEPGDMLYTPPNAVHTFVNDGDVPARAIAFNSFGGFFEMSQELAEIRMGENGPNPAEMERIAGSYGAEIFGPPLSA